MTVLSVVKGRGVGQRGHGQRIVYVLERSGIPIFLVAIIVLFAMLPSTGTLFRSAPNIQNILANQSVTGLIALAMMTPLIAGYFDLSVAAIAGVSNVVVGALLATHGQTVLVSVIAGILAGVLVGAVNGFLVAVLRLNAFITTLGTYILISGVLQMYTGGRTINQGIPISFSLWSAGQWFGVARPFWLLLIVALAVWFFVKQTPFGRKLVAIGCNEPAARLVGFRVDRALFLTFVVSGLLAGMAGALLTARNGGADSTSAISYLFPALAAVFLGQTAINPGHSNVWGTMFGLFLVAVAVNGFTLLGSADWVSQVFNGGALLMAVALSTFMARGRQRSARAAQLAALHSDEPAPAAERAA